MNQVFQSQLPNFDGCAFFFLLLIIKTDIEQQIQLNKKFILCIIMENILSKDQVLIPLKKSQKVQPLEKCTTLKKSTICHIDGGPVMH